MKNISFHALIILSCILPVNGFSQIHRLSVSFSNDSILIGQQTDLVIQLAKDKNVNVIFPLFADTLLSELEIISNSEIDTMLSGKDIILTQKYHVTAFDSGSFTIPSIPFPVHFSGIKDTIHSLPVSLRVDRPEITPNSSFRDIKPAINTPVNFKEALPYILGGLVVILLAILAIFFFRKFFYKKKITDTLITEIPPYILALEELQKLRSEKGWEKLSIKDYYTQLSGIVRTYIENQFAINALESTTCEILKRFEKVYGKNRDIKNKLEELLQLSDLVKFAKEIPTPDMNLKNLDKAILFVELTKPVTTEKHEENEITKPENE